jgi:hypothetical protein
MARRLGGVYVINVSYMVQWLYDLIAMFMNDITKNKFRFVRGDLKSVEATLSPLMDMKYVPTELGGGYDVNKSFRVDDYLDSDVYLSWDPSNPPPLYS